MTNVKRHVMSLSHSDMVMSSALQPGITAWYVVLTAGRLSRCHFPIHWVAGLHLQMETCMNGVVTQWHANRSGLLLVFVVEFSVHLLRWCVFGCGCHMLRCVTEWRLVLKMVINSQNCGKWEVYPKTGGQQEVLGDWILLHPHYRIQRLGTLWWFRATIGVQIWAQSNEANGNIIKDEKKSTGHTRRKPARCVSQYHTTNNHMGHSMEEKRKPDKYLAKILRETEDQLHWIGN